LPIFTTLSILRYPLQLVQAHPSLPLPLSTAINRTVRYSEIVCVYNPGVVDDILLAVVQSASDRHIHIFPPFTTTQQHTTTAANHHNQKPNDTLLHSTVSTAFLLPSSRSPCHDQPLTKDLSLTFITRQSTTLFLVGSASYKQRARDRNLTDSSKLS